MWLDQTQVLSFTRPTSGAKQTFETRIEPAGAAEILQPATLLDGEKIGFLRIIALKPGSAQLRVGNTRLPLKIVPASTAGTASRKAPEIITPRGGAFLFGTVTIGVQLQLPSATTPTDVKLSVGDRPALSPRAQTLPTDGSDRIFVFDVNADELPPGPVKLQSSARDAQGHSIQSAPVYAMIARPDPSAMISGPCSQFNNGARPERFGEKIPLLGKADASAPDGFVLNNSADPAWCLNQKVAESGHYQFYIRARGTPAAGSFPSVGLIIDDREKAETTTRLVDRDWQRIPLGNPVYLEAGEHILTARFLNDFAAAKGADRNLHLERFEMVRVSTGSSNPAAEGMMTDSPAMMAAPAMTPEKMAPSMMAMEAGGLIGSGDVPVSVAFSRAFDGQMLNGPLQFKAFARWSEGLPPPRVDVVLNDKVYTSQYGREMEFKIPSEVFKPGKNTIQLRAEFTNGIAETSPKQTVILPQAAGISRSRVPRILRFGVIDPAWDASFKQRQEKLQGKDFIETAAFYTNGESLLTLPEELAGNFEIKFEARGQEFKGAPIAEALLRVGETTTSIGQDHISGNYRSYSIGKTQLPVGPKQLIVRFSNDAMEPKKGDRNLWLKSVQLEEVVKKTERPPSVALLYTPATTVASANGGADAVVAEGFATEGIKSADLLIDGKPQESQQTSRDGLGRLVFPLLTRGLQPGMHQIQVRVLSKNGQEATSRQAALRVAATSKTPAKNQYARAVHLLNRFGYGPDPEALADILILGESRWLRDQLNQSGDAAGDQSLLAVAKLRFPNDDRGAVISRTLLHLLLTQNPVRSRFVMWTENHFSTWMQKTEPRSKWLEHTRFLELGVAPFRELLFASATSPAMLVYLDQFRSLTGKLNENYAREIMELHTVGVHGGYTQSDVTNLAGLLTGWTLSSDAALTGKSAELIREFRYEPAANTAEPRRVFGMDFPEAAPAARYDRAKIAIEMLAAHPRTAEFISRKLAEHYVSVPAPDSLVKRLAQVFRQTGGDLKEVMMAISTSPEFWATQGSPKLATPLDYGLRLCRLTDTINPGALAEFLRKSGTGLFDRATPDGYPENDDAYADSNAMLQRWNFSKALKEKLPSLVPSNLTAASTQWTPALEQGVLDLVATRLFGQPLSERSNQAAIQYLQQAGAPEKDRLKLAATFITQLPENSLR